MSEGEIAIIAAILFAAFKDRLAAEWYKIRKALFWRPVNKFRHNRRMKGNGNGT